jgi:hypothetical protein
VRQISRVFFALALASLGVAAAAGSAGAGVQSQAAPLTVVKTVSGPVPAGTTFTATVTCNSDIIVGPSGSTNTVTVSFDSTGQPTTPDTYGFNDPGTCTVTETATGGAATTTYSCDSSVTEPPTTTTSTTTTVVPSSARASFGGGSQAVSPESPICPAAGPQADPITVNIEVENQTATVTINNTFNAPAVEPAAAVAATPTFTG